jgi:multiple sugar transport system substrate-binding protein
VPQAIAAMTSGEIDPGEAAKQAADALREIAQSLE